MKKIVALLVVGCLLATGCSTSQAGSEVFGDFKTDIASSLLTDGTSIWFLESDSRWTDDPVVLYKINATSGEVDWRREFGLGTRSELILDGGVLWTAAYDALPPSTVEKEDVLFQIEAETGEEITQQEVANPALRSPLVVVDDTAWAHYYDFEINEIRVYDIDTFEVVGSSGSDEWLTPSDSLRLPTDMVLLDDTVWLLDGADLVGLDAETYEAVDGFDTNDGGLNLMEVHDGLLWVGELDKPDEGTFSYNPKTKEKTPSELFESPIGSTYHDGYTFDMVDPTTIKQINTETGEEVATFEDVDPFSVVVTDGYLWAHDGKRISRYPTVP